MDIKEENKKLCAKYPFLIPWNRMSGQLLTESDPEYDYEFTELDSMPDGWRKAFGLQMCDELRDALIECGDIDRWRIVQLKEKYGGLRLYDNGYKSGSKVPDIISKYENISLRTCIICGEPATRITTGWISPFCDKCVESIECGHSVPIEEFYGNDNDGGK